MLVTTEDRISPTRHPQTKTGATTKGNNHDEPADDGSGPAFPARRHRPFARPLRALPDRVERHQAHAQQVKAESTRLTHKRGPVPECIGAGPALDFSHVRPRHARGNGTGRGRWASVCDSDVHRPHRFITMRRRSAEPPISPRWRWCASARPAAGPPASAAPGTACRPCSWRGCRYP